MDENMHLISACQLAGFRHVVGTLWEVNDKLCLEMARILYQVIANDGLTDESVCLGLHKATRELRDRWLKTRAGATREAETLSLKEGETPAGSSAPENRNAMLLTVGSALSNSQEKGDRPARPMYWVPYVHFGV